MIQVAASKRRVAQRERSQSVHLPPPDGINVADAAASLGPSDAMAMVNLIRGEYGARPRLGYRDWVTGLTNPVRCIIPYAGGLKDASKAKVFATTKVGIFDVTTSTDSPGAAVYTFTTQTGNAGYGIFTTFSTAAGRFIVYCDEANGLFTYSETTGAWDQVVATGSAAYAGGTTYALGDHVTDVGVTYVSLQGTNTGHTPASSPTWWRAVFDISGVDPANLRFAMAWKTRLFFVEKDSTRAWFMPVGQIGGVATSLDIGTRFRYGGHLVGLWSWTLDGGVGIDDHLVAISSAGDVVIYQGTDPSSASLFGMRGAWYCGGVPTVSRRIATDLGGDLLILTTLGVLPLSRLVQGGEKLDPSMFASRKIGSLFNSLMTARRGSGGWDIRVHPEDNSLIVIVPDASGYPSEQLAMALTTKGWSVYNGVPILSADVFGKSLYFGTSTGKVCINDGTVDGASIAGSNGISIAWSYISSFNEFGQARKKQVRLLAADFITDGVAPSWGLKARFDFDMSGNPPAITSSTVNPSIWDTGLWDAATWGGGSGVASGITGSDGIGSHVAVELAGNSTSKVIYSGCEITWEFGGVL